MDGRHRGFGLWRRRLLVACVLVAVIMPSSAARLVDDASEEQQAGPREPSMVPLEWVLPISGVQLDSGAASTEVMVSTDGDDNRDTNDGINQYPDEAFYSNVGPNPYARDMMGSWGPVGSSSEEDDSSDETANDRDSNLRRMIEDAVKQSRPFMPEMPGIMLGAPQQASEDSDSDSAEDEVLLRRPEDGIEREGSPGIEAWKRLVARAELMRLMSKLEEFRLAEANKNSLSDGLKVQQNNEMEQHEQLLQQEQNQLQQDQAAQANTNDEFVLRLKPSATEDEDRLSMNFEAPAHETSADQLGLPMLPGSDVQQQQQQQLFERPNDTSYGGVSIVFVPVWRIIERTVYLTSSRPTTNDTADNAWLAGDMFLVLLTCLVIFAFFFAVLFAALRSIQRRRERFAVLSHQTSKLPLYPQSPAYGVPLGSPMGGLPTTRLHGDSNLPEKPPLEPSKV